jgi:ribosome recycling factor
MNEDEVRKRMKAVEELISTDVASIRTGRATSSLVEDLEVSVYGGAQKLKINELATITAPEPENIIIDPWDKSIIGEIKKGIEAANIGMNPSIDGEIVRITFPPMTTQDREKYVKLLNKKIENGKIMIRQIRGDFMKDIKTGFEEKEISEDEKFNLEKKLQEITDKFTDNLDEIAKVKEAEIMKI